MPDKKEPIGSQFIAFSFLPTTALNDNLNRKISLDYTNAVTVNLNSKNQLIAQDGMLFPYAVYSSKAYGVYYVYINDKNIVIGNILHANARIALVPLLVSAGDSVRSRWDDAINTSDLWILVPYK